MGPYGTWWAGEEPPDFEGGCDPPSPPTSSLGPMEVIYSRPFLSNPGPGLRWQVQEQLERQQWLYSHLPALPVLQMAPGCLSVQSEFSCLPCVS